jgi:hypothetical protein
MAGLDLVFSHHHWICVPVILYDPQWLWWVRFFAPPPRAGAGRWPQDLRSVLTCGWVAGFGGACWGLRRTDGPQGAIGGVPCPRNTPRWAGLSWAGPLARKGVVGPGRMRWGRLFSGATGTALLFRQFLGVGRCGWIHQRLRMTPGASNLAVRMIPAAYGPFRGSDTLMAAKNRHRFAVVCELLEF